MVMWPLYCHGNVAPYCHGNVAPYCRGNMTVVALYAFHDVAGIVEQKQHGTACVAVKQ